MPSCTDKADISRLEVARHNIMKSLVFLLLLFICCCKYVAAAYWDTKIDTNSDPGEPLFLTDFIRSGRIAEAKQRALVQHPALSEFNSYAGYLTISKAYNSNTFFWFFPSRTNPKSDPIILWFIGGPGLTCLISIFNYNGPFFVSADGIFQNRNHSLVDNHNVIYIDNPIGTGFSFTDDDKGYAKDEPEVATDVIIFLKQFFKLFPEYGKNDLYAGGDSYGGKFAISAATAIRKYNYKGKFVFNSIGLILGNGLVDLLTQTNNDEYLYQIGAIDKKQRDQIQEYAKEKPYDFIGRFVYEATISGYSYFSNFLYSEDPFNAAFTKWVVKPDFRSAVHVGTRDMNFTSDIVRGKFDYHFYDPVITEFQILLRENIRVLVYSGQMDMTFPYVSNEKLYESLFWPETYEYGIAERSQWWVDGELAGYVRSTRNFVHAVVYKSGHVTFLEQPKWTCELINRFTHRDVIARKNEQLRASPPKFKHVYF